MALPSHLSTLLASIVLKEIQMQVFCLATTEPADVQCKVCGQNYALYFERKLHEEREEAMQVVMAVKESSLASKRLLTDEEFRGIVEKTLPHKVAGAAHS